MKTIRMIALLLVVLGSFASAADLPTITGNCLNCTFERTSSSVSEWMHGKFQFRITPNEGNYKVSSVEVKALCPFDSADVHSVVYQSLSYSTVSGNENTYEAALPSDDKCSEVKVEAMAERFYTVTNTAEVAIDGIVKLAIMSSSDIIHSEFVYSAREGDDIYIFGHILDGAYYDVDSVWYCLSPNCADSAKIKVSTSTAGFYFTMPASDVWFGATYKRSMYAIIPKESPHCSLSVSSASAYPDSIVTLKVVPDPGYEVDSVWYCTTSICSGSDKRKIPESSGSYTFTMPITKAWVGVAVKAKSYTITKTNVTNGSLSVSKTNANVGNTITVTPSANTGYEVDSVWYCTLSNCTGSARKKITVSSGSYTFTMPASNVWVGAEFKQVVFDISEMISPENGGTSTIPSSGRAGNKIEFTVTPKNGYEVDSVWYCTSSSCSGSARTKISASSGKYTFTMPKSNVWVGAEFKLVTYTISSSVEKIDGVVPGSVALDATSGKMGDKITYHINSKAGYEAKGVTIEKNAGGSVEPDCNADYSLCTFTMPSEPVKITALFEPKVYKITYEQTENGTFTVSADECAMGSTFTVSWKPDEGYDAVVTVMAGDETLSYDASGDRSYSYKMPASDVNVSVEFVPAEYSLHLNDAENGSYSASKTTGIHRGDEIIITTTPVEGYEVSQIDIGSASSTAKDIEDATDESPLPYSLKKIAENKYSFIMPAAIIPIAVRFAPIEYAIRTEGHATIRTFGTVNSAFAEISTATHLSDGGTQNAVMIGAKANEGYEITGMTAVEKTTGTPIAEVDLSLMELTEEDLLDTLKKGTEMLGAAFEADRAFAIAMPADSVLITIETKAIDYSITASAAEPEKGSVSAPATANIGDVVTFAVTPAAGYVLDKIVVTPEGGEAETLVCEETGCDYVMPAKNVSAIVTFKNSEKVTITFKFGDKTETAEVEKGFKPTAPISFKCAENTAEYTYTCAWDKEFVAVTDAATYTYTETKTKNSYVIKVAVNDTKMGSVTGLSETGKYEYGTEIELTATAKTGYEFSSWQDAVKTATRTVKVTGDETYTATFKAVAASSSSAKSSSSTAKSKSSSSKGKDAIAAMAQLPQFSVTAVARDVQIAGAKVGAPFAILDMQGRVMTSGRVESANFNLAVNRAGTFMIRIGSETQIVGVK